MTELGKALWGSEVRSAAPSSGVRAGSGMRTDMLMSRCQRQCGGAFHLESGALHRDSESSLPSWALGQAASPVLAQFPLVCNGSFAPKPTAWGQKTPKSLVSSLLFSVFVA